MADSERVEFDGHTYVLSKLGTGKQMRVMRMIGGEAANNQPYLSMAIALFAIQSIDGIPVPPCDSPEKFEQLADRLGEAVQPVMEAFARLHGDGTNTAEEIEQAKN